jgi:hypothetical protein
VRSPVAKPLRAFPVNKAAVDFCRTQMVLAESSEMAILAQETL